MPIKSSPLDVNMEFPPVRNVIQNIGVSGCEVFYHQHMFSYPYYYQGFRRRLRSMLFVDVKTIHILMIGLSTVRIGVGVNISSLSIL